MNHSWSPPAEAPYGESLISLMHKHTHGEPVQRQGYKIVEASGPCSPPRTVSDSPAWDPEQLAEDTDCALQSC